MLNFFVFFIVSRNYAEGTGIDFYAKMKDFTCPGMNVVSVDAVYMDTGYVPVPSWVVPLYTCDLTGPMNITFEFAAPSLGLGKWTLFYGGTGVLSIGENVISVPGLNGLALTTQPVNVTYRIPAAMTIYLPSFYVSVPVISSNSNTSAILGTIVLSIVFLAIVASIRVVL